MEGMTKTIGDNQERICFLESLNRQLEGTVEDKNKQSQEVCLKRNALSWKVKVLIATWIGLLEAWLARKQIYRF